MIALAQVEDRVLLGAFGLALVLHLGMAAASLTTERPRPRPEPRVMEVALAPPPPVTPSVPEATPPPPPPRPTPIAEEAAASPPRPARVRRAPHREPASAEPPPAARAGEVLTAEGPGPREAVRFVSDANGGRFGHGVVAVGGTAERGLVGARVGGEALAPTPPSPPPAAPSPEVTPASELRRPPALQRADPCADVFPERATADRAEVTVRLVVRSDGATGRLAIERETPSGQGFGVLARRCLQRERFVPALDRDGQPTPAAARVTIRFVR